MEKCECGCNYTSNDSRKLDEIHEVVNHIRDHQADCIEGFKANRDAMEKILNSLDMHLTKFGSNLDKLTDRLDRVLSQGMIPVAVLKWIVLSFIVTASAFVIITLVFVLGWDGVKAILDLVRVANVV